MSGTNRLVLSESMMENENASGLAEDLLNANEEALSALGVKHEKEE